MSSSIRRLQDIFFKPRNCISAAATLADSLSRTATSTVEKTSNISPISPPSEIRTLVQKFKNNSRRNEFRRRQDRYEDAVNRLAAGKYYSEIETILEYQKKFKDSMSYQGFGVKLISLYGKAGMFEHAYKLFDELPQFSCPRTVTTFNALLCACVNSKKFDKLSELFKELPEKLDIEPNVVSYNTVIKAFCVMNDFDSAMNVMDKMEESPIRPDTVSYNTMLEAYYKENRLAEAEKLWQRMEENGVTANVRTYNAKIRSLIRNCQLQEALELVEKMVSDKVNPDKYTYNAVIKGCVDSGKLDEAKILHGKMVRGDCLPDIRTYGMLIPFACEKGDTNFALELTKQSFELKVFVRRKSMQLGVEALIEGSKIEEAKEIVALVNSSKHHRYTLVLPVTE